MATPEAELTIDEELISRLVREQHPVFADLPIVVVANGWDNVMARLGPELVVRLPRRQASAQLVEHEQKWLPMIAPRLPLPVPVPVAAGRPDANYPWAWNICRWLPGSAASEVPPSDAAAAARTLAGFVAALHQPAPADAPTNPFRGVHLRERAAAVEERVARLADRVPGDRVLQLWDRLRAAPAWAGPPLWLHGDLHPSNLLTHEGRLAAVIDFGDLTSGDPATDLAVAWMMFAPPERSLYREVAELDDNTWQRAAGWALNLGLAYLTGDDTTSMPAIGAKTLAAVLDEFD